MPRSLIIAAPSSGSGKTTLTLALLRALKRDGVQVASMKSGPDYIDPAFHHAASGRPCINLVLWAMRPGSARQAIDAAGDGAQLVVAEGVMGLFDGAVGDKGSTADIAAATGWPVVLVVDAGGMAASVAALVRGFNQHRADVRVAAVIFNRVGSDRHAAVLREAMADLEIAVLGCVRRDAKLELPERHLGLVQASEHAALGAFLDYAAERVVHDVDLAALRALALPDQFGRPQHQDAVAPPGQRVAIARDVAFAFAYPHLLNAWQAAGASVHPFSPLADEAPDENADFVYLPGGYPELYAGELSAHQRFAQGMWSAVKRDVLVFGECGGYMVLGDAIVDADGVRHSMLGALPVVTSFAERRLHLGYRAVTTAGAERSQGFLADGQRFMGHEFHYASVVEESKDGRLFDCKNARGRALGQTGHVRGSVAGSYIHLIDTAGYE